MSQSSFKISTALAIQQQSFCHLSNAMKIGFCTSSIFSTFLFSPMLTTLAVRVPAILSQFSSQIIRIGQFLINCSKQSTIECHHAVWGRIHFNASILFSEAEAKQLLWKHIATLTTFTFIPAIVLNSLAKRYSKWVLNTHISFRFPLLSSRFLLIFATFALLYVTMTRIFVHSLFQLLLLLIVCDSRCSVAYS